VPLNPVLVTVTDLRVHVQADPRSVPAQDILISEYALIILHVPASHRVRDLNPGPP